MQSSEIVLYNLSKQARKEGYLFDRLYRNLYNSDFYMKAYAKIYKNAGSATKGTDDDTADGFGEEIIEKTIEALKEEKYQPKPVRRTYISKNKKIRPLGIPSFIDRIVQEICRMMLEAIFEPTFSKHSHGFRAKHSCHTALYEIKKTFHSVNWFIEGDIKGFFDNIDHNILMEILKKRIKDERFIRLMWKFLRAGYLEDWVYNKTFSGTPQGGIISPILANIYLNEFDKWITEELKENFKVGNRKSQNRNSEYRKYEARNGRLKKKVDIETDSIKRKLMIEQYKENKKILLNIPYYEPMNKEFKSIKYVRYADDFLIGVNGSKEDCQFLKNKIGRFLKEKLNLDMSKEKTLITHCSKPAKFLSYLITIRNNLSTKKDKNGKTKRMFNGVVKLSMPKNIINNAILERKMVKDIDSKSWKIQQRPELLGLSDLEIVSTFNAELRGLYNYYSMAENVSVKMWQLRYVMEYSCLKTLANKYKSSIGKMKKKYKNGKHWGIKYRTKQGEKTLYFYKDGFRKKNPIKEVTVDEKTNIFIYQARGELEKRMNARICELCGTEDKNLSYEVHHINKLKNLKGKERWEVVMLARKRKTLIVCKKCHIDIHAGRG